MIEWTQELPKEEGWYWIAQYNKDFSRTYISACDIEHWTDDFIKWDLKISTASGWIKVEDFASQPEVFIYWYGPLVPPAFKAPEAETHTQVSLSELRPAEANVERNRGYLEQGEGSESPYVQGNGQYQGVMYQT